MKLTFAVAVAIPAFSLAGAAQSPPKAEVFPSAQIQASLVQLAKSASNKGSSGFTLGEYGSHTIMLSERTASGGAEVHAHFDDVMMVMEGKAILVTGGDVIDPHFKGNGEIAGSGVRNGVRQPIAAGDVVHIPAGTPHQLVIALGTTYSALVIKVKE